ncbi:MAG: EAL domain-containing protein [Methylococcaceae bacterium]|nr:EAL domain-containing protein [Methylococcaceae bacterium]
MEIQGTRKNSLKAPSSSDFKFKGNVLLAEDDLIQQEVCMGMLQAIGYQAHAVNNGLKALQALIENHYDLILMDCHMPEMDGFQATIQIRQREQSQPNKPRLPIIALSTDIQKGMVEQCLQAGMDSYIGKPFSKQQLEDVIERWLPIKHTEPNDCNTHHSENTVVNSNPVELENLQPLTPAANDRFPTIKILLIDDDPNFRLITSETLRAAAFFVDEASNGAEALEKIKHQLPDIVLLDSMMEGINGFQTCRLLRTDPAMADVPVIMSTTLSDSDSINKAFDAGATDFIVKPINYETFIHHLYFILRACQNTAELRNSRLQLTALTALKAAQRIARFGYWTWHIKNNQFQISAHLANLCGINLEQFDGTLDGFIQLIHPQDRDFVKDMITAAAHSKTHESAEYRLQVAKSEAIFVHQEIETVTDKNELIITGTVQDITRQKEAEKQIRHLAYYDNLTGLASRTYYQERIESLIKTAGRRNEQFAFLFLDLDDFKEINDHFGHHIGDQFLNAIAHRLKFIAREIDFIARLGGDEFCLIIDNIIDDNDVIEVATRCLQKINQPLLLDQHQLIPSVSIGIAVFPRDGLNESELIKAADTAMFSAKQAGKQCYVFHSQNMADQAIQRREKERLLREAFKLEQFILYYQPQLSMNSGQIVGMEALIRWQHPEQGIILPENFITLVEQLGLIVELGNWAIKTVCEQISKWHRSGLPFIQVAVNLSPAHFQDLGLIDTVQDLLNKAGIPAHYLELEVTESAMQTKGHIEVFKQLRKIGVKIAIDDFGTGFSCLASLKQLPLDCLKIDKIFVDDMLYNSHTSLLLGTIIGLANALDYTLVAEGVETKDQALVLQSLGCNIVQGFFFSPAVPADDIPALINSHVSRDAST